MFISFGNNFTKWKGNTTGEFHPVILSQDFLSTYKLDIEQIILPPPKSGCNNYIDCNQRGAFQPVRFSIKRNKRCKNDGEKNTCHQHRAKN